MKSVDFDDTSITLPSGFGHIRRYVKKLAKHHPVQRSNVFVIMPFGESRHSMAVVRAIKSALEEYGLNGLRADDRHYAPPLWDNVATYIFGCKFCIAVIEKEREESFNPNVAIELGFALALGKRVLILKDKRLKSLPSDIIGNLYREFNARQLGHTIKRQVRTWAKKDLGRKKRKRAN